MPTQKKQMELKSRMQMQVYVQYIKDKFKDNIIERLTPDSRAPAKQRLLAYGVGRLGRDSPHKPREGYVELRQA